MEHRKRFSSKEKMMILRELLENKVQIGELSALSAYISETKKLRQIRVN